MERRVGLLLLSFVGLALHVASTQANPLCDESDVVAYWSFDGDGVAIGQSPGPSSVIDDVNQNNSTLIVGSPVYSADVPVSTNQTSSAVSLDFNASNGDGVVIRNLNGVSFADADGFKIQAWVKLKSHRSRNMIVSKKSASAFDSLAHYLFWINSAGQLSFQYGGGEAGAQVLTSAFAQSVPLGSWVHIGVSYDRETDSIHFFKNEETYSVYNPAAFQPTELLLTDELILGAKKDFSGSFTEFLDGTLDEVQLIRGPSCPAPPAFKVVMIGDSITEGMVSGDDALQSDAFVPLLKGQYPMMDMWISNLGCGGATSRDWTVQSAEVCGGEVHDPNVFESKFSWADVAFVLLGTNDATGFWEEEGPLNGPEYRETMARLIDRLRKEDVDLIVLATPPQNISAPEEVKERLIAYADVIKELCSTESSTTCGPDLYNLLQPSDFDEFDVHPNADGHKKIAVALAVFLDELTPPLSSWEYVLNLEASSMFNGVEPTYTVGGGKMPLLINNSRVTLESVVYQYSEEWGFYMDHVHALAFDFDPSSGLITNGTVSGEWFSGSENGTIDAMSGGFVDLRTGRITMKVALSNGQQSVFAADPIKEIVH